jgi:chitin disaccharide deacetylase
MARMRYLVVNADDFGQSHGVNLGVVRAHEQGIVTSASLMVRWPAAAEAAAYGREHPELSLGLHFDLGEWVYSHDAWTPVYEVAAMDDPPAVADELAGQLVAFRRLAGREPTHIDSHQHVHRREPVRSLVREAARRLGVPLRHCSAKVRYCGHFYGQTGKGAPLPENISLDALLGILETLPPGVTELACHPGEGSGLGSDRDSTYGSERAQELGVLCDPRVRAAIAAAGIRLCSFGNLPARSPGLAH